MEQSYILVTFHEQMNELAMFLIFSILESLLVNEEQAFILS